MSVKFPSIKAMILKTDITSTDASFKLRSLVNYVDANGSNVEISASDFGTKMYICFEPRSSRMEFATADPSTISGYATTGITILSRGLPWGSDYTTEATTRKFSHPSGSQVLLFTDAPAMWNTMANKENDETITGKYTFPTGTNYPVIGSSYSAPTDDKHIATKKYADDLAIAGAPDASTTVKGIIEIATAAENAASTATGGTGAILVPATSDCTSVRSSAGYANRIVVTDANGYISQTFMDTARTWGAVQSLTANNCQITSDADSANDAVRQSFLKAEISKGYTTGTAGETLVAGDAVYLKASDSKLWKADTDADESTFSFVGIIVTGGVADATVYYARSGDIATGLSGLTAGSYYYLTGTAGAIGTTPGTRFAKVAQALSTTTARIIEPKFRVIGNFTLSATGDTAVTTGFYPADVKFMFSSEAGSTLVASGEGGFSLEGTNAFITNIEGASSGRSTIYDAYPIIIGPSNGNFHKASITARSATGFTVTNAMTGSPGNGYVYWVAESL